LKLLIIYIVYETRLAKVIKHVKGAKILLDESLKFPVSIFHFPVNLLID